MESKNQVVVIGGGPAGSAMGAYLSLAGVDNVILEKAVHPRPHVGESLVPSTTRVFREIGFLAIMEREGFVRKYGAAWHSLQRAAEYSIWFKEFPQPGVEQDYTYHVDRARFDQLLFEHARRLGSRTLTEAHVLEVIFEGERAVGVRFRRQGRERVIRADCVVDASGRACVVGNHLRWKRKDPQFDQFALHSWFEGVHRGQPPTDDFIHIYFLPIQRGWAWQIPITDSITSVGLVVDKKSFRGFKGQAETWFAETARTSPDLAAALAPARRVTELRAEGDYSYSMERFSGDGFVLVGDAARFVDPIFSSGVSVALHSSRFAARSIAAGLKQGGVTAENLRGYDQRLRAGVDVWYEFICLYYRLTHLFTNFIRHPEFRPQVLQLLQGEVFDRQSVPVLDRMRRVIGEVEATPNHVWRQFLGDIRLPAQEPESEVSEDRLLT